MVQGCGVGDRRRRMKDGEERRIVKERGLEDRLTRFSGTKKVLSDTEPMAGCF